MYACGLVPAKHVQYKGSYCIPLKIHNIYGGYMNSGYYSDRGFGGLFLHINIRKSAKIKELEIILKCLQIILIPKSFQLVLLFSRQANLNYYG